MTTEPTDLMDIYREDPRGCIEALNCTRGAGGRMVWDGSDEVYADDGPVTIQALAAAHAKAHWRTLAAMLARAPEDVRAEYARLAPEEEAEVDADLGGGWRASTVRAESTHGQPYVAATCRHGEAAAHSLEEALDCGIIDAVRHARGLSRERVAQQVGCTVNAVHRWARGEMMPTGMYRQALEAWLRPERPVRV